MSKQAIWVGAGVLVLGGVLIYVATRPKTPLLASTSAAGLGGLFGGLGSLVTSVSKAFGGSSSTPPAAYNSPDAPNTNGGLLTATPVNPADPLGVGTLTAPDFGSSFLD
jgi:hypothetical protein